MGPKSKWPAALSLFVGFLAFSSAQTVNYSYDDAGRLVQASYPSGATISYTYDPAGNLLRREVTAGTPFTTVSSASFERGAPLAAEAIASGFGSGLARDVADATVVPLPTELLGTRVEVTDSRGTSRDAPLFFVSPGQINYLIPPGTATGTARITVTSGAGGTADGTVEIERVAPALYTANARGTGVAAGFYLRVAGDGSRTQELLFNPATAASVALDLGPASDQVFLLLFGTGIRGFTDAVTASADGENIPVPGAVPQGQFVGQDQVNLGPLPRTLAGRGEVDVILTVDGRRANTVTANIR